MVMGMLSRWLFEEVFDALGRIRDPWTPRQFKAIGLFDGLCKTVSTAALYHALGPESLMAKCLLNRMGHLKLVVNPVCLHRAQTAPLPPQDIGFASVLCVRDGNLILI